MDHGSELLRIQKEDLWEECRVLCQRVGGFRVRAEGLEFKVYRVKAFWVCSAQCRDQGLVYVCC